MKAKYPKTMLIAMCLLVVGGCASVYTPSVPTQADADRGSAMFPGLTLVELNIGKSNHDLYCNKCHNYESPASHTTAEWNKIIPKMSAIAKKKGRGEITPDAQESIRKYIITMMNSQHDAK